MNSIREFFAQLPSEETHEFDSEITEYVNFSELSDKITDIMRILTGDERDKVRYAAFYCLVLHYRNEKNIEAINRLFDNHKEAFSSHPTFRHLELVCKLKVQQFDHPLDMVQDSYKLSLENKTNAGVVHLFADIVITMMEKGLLTDNCERWILLALEASNRAIVLDEGYAKYYATKARILLHNSDYEDAIKHIEIAINIESPKRFDYIQKINDYNYYRYNIIMKREQALLDQKIVEQAAAFDEMNAKYKNMNSKIDNTMLRNLEILGFFTAIISFTIGSLELSRGQTVFDAARLIVILFMSLVFVYSCFGILFQPMDSTKTMRRCIWTAVISLFMIGGMLFWICP